MCVLFPNPVWNGRKVDDDIYPCFLVRGRLDVIEFESKTHTDGPFTQVNPRRVLSWGKIVCLIETPEPAEFLLLVHSLSGSVLHEHGPIKKAVTFDYRRS